MDPSTQQLSVNGTFENTVPTRGNYGRHHKTFKHISLVYFLLYLIFCYNRFVHLYYNYRLQNSSYLCFVSIVLVLRLFYNKTDKGKQHSKKKNREGLYIL